MYNCYIKTQGFKMKKYFNLLLSILLMGMFASVVTGCGSDTEKVEQELNDLEDNIKEDSEETDDQQNDDAQSDDITGTVDIKFNGAANKTWNVTKHTTQDGYATSSATYVKIQTEHADNIKFLINVETDDGSLMFNIYFPTSDVMTGNLDGVEISYRDTRDADLYTTSLVQEVVAAEHFTINITEAKDNSDSIHLKGNLTATIYKSLDTLSVPTEIIIEFDFNAIERS